MRFFSAHPPARSRAGQIDPAQEEVELRLRQFDSGAFALWPREGAPLEPFRATPQPASVEVENLDAVAAAVAKDKEMAAERVGPQRRQDEGVEPVEALAHVRRCAGDVDLCRRTGRPPRRALLQRRHDPAKLGRTHARRQNNLDAIRKTYQRPGGGGSEPAHTHRAEARRGIRLTALAPPRAQAGHAQTMLTAEKPPGSGRSLRKAPAVARSRARCVAHGVWWGWMIRP